MLQTYDLQPFLLVFSVRLAPRYTDRNLVPAAAHRDDSSCCI